MLQKPNYQDYSYSKSNSKTIAIDRLSKKEEDNIVASISDLNIDPNYKPYLFTRLKKIGATTFIAAADQARKHGKEKDRYFIYLIRN